MDNLVLGLLIYRRIVRRGLVRYWEEATFRRRGRETLNDRLVLELDCNERIPNVNKRGTRGNTGIVGIVKPDSDEASTPPNIFEVSHSIFSSSPPIYGTTLSKISKLATPGYPTIIRNPQTRSY